MLTPHEQLVLSALESAFAARGLCPRYEDIASATGLKSKSRVHAAIVGLEAKRKIRRLHHRARAIEILRPIDPSPAFYFRFDDASKTLVLTS